MKNVFHLLILAVVFCLGCARSETTEQPATPVQTQAQTNDWPFDVAPDTAVISLKRITHDSRPILRVVHDEDGDWQFLDGGDVSDEDAAIVSLKNLVDRDPSLKALADLPAGWTAERSAIDQAWQRSPR